MTMAISGQNGKEPRIVWELNMEQEVIEVPEGPVPNPDWVDEDNGCGKEHRWEFKKDGKPKKFQSWIYREDYMYWCEECRDEHPAGHDECRACGAIVDTRGAFRESAKIELFPGIRTWGGSIELFDKWDWGYPDLSVPFDINKYIPDYCGQVFMSTWKDDKAGYVSFQFVGTGKLEAVDAKRTKKTK